MVGGVNGLNEAAIPSVVVAIVNAKIQHYLEDPEAFRVLNIRTNNLTKTISTEEFPMYAELNVTGEVVEG